MKRVLRVLFLGAVVALAAAAAIASADEKKAAEPAQVTIVGEIIDTGCYLGHAAKGEKHAECAGKCIAGGMPMALLTDKDELYLLTPPHKTPDAYAKCKEWAAKRVEVTGTVMERNGMKALEVASAKPAPAAPATPAAK